MFSLLPSGESRICVIPEFILENVSVCLCVIFHRRYKIRSRFHAFGLMPFFVIVLIYPWFMTSARIIFTRAKFYIYCMFDVARSDVYGKTARINSMCDCLF